jgi:hypothetical protein
MSQTGVFSAATSTVFGGGLESTEDKCCHDLTSVGLLLTEDFGEVVALAVRTEEDLLKLLAFAWDVAALLVLCVDLYKVQVSI